MNKQKKNPNPPTPHREQTPPFSKMHRFVDVGVNSILGFYSHKERKFLFSSLFFFFLSHTLSLHPAIASTPLPELVVGGELDLLTQVSLPCLGLRKAV